MGTVVVQGTVEYQQGLRIGWMVVLETATLKDLETQEHHRIDL